jgi:hypothetical protein
MAAETLRKPVRNVIATEIHVVDADVLHAAFTVREDLQLAVRRIDELVVALMRVVDADLPVACTVGDEERYADLCHHAVQVHPGRLLEKLVHVLRAKHPHHVVPVMRHGILALAIQALLLHLGPVVIRAPDGAAGEARFLRDRTSDEIAAE